MDGPKGEKQRKFSPFQIKNSGNISFAHLVIWFLVTHDEMKWANMDWTRSRQALDKEILGKYTVIFWLYWKNIELV